MSALATISNKEELIQRVCVARDEKVGVYGFVFHRGKDTATNLVRFQTNVSQMANGFQRLSTTSFTSSKKILMKPSSSAITGWSFRTARVQKTNTAL